MRSILSLILVWFIAVVGACKETAPAAETPAHGATPTATETAPATAVAADAKCEHGVQKDICARCNPGLKAAFVAKNDWCAEHERPESQCATCHPKLAEAGIKP